MSDAIYKHCWVYNIIYKVYRVTLGSAAMKQINMFKARSDLPFPYKI